MVQVSILAQLLNHAGHGGVKNREHQLRRQTKHESNHDRRNNDGSFMQREFGALSTFFIKWTEKHLAKKREQINGRQQQSEHSGSAGQRREPERSLENQKFRRKTAQPRQTERREKGDSHQTGE